MPTQHQVVLIAAVGRDEGGGGGGEGVCAGAVGVTSTGYKHLHVDWFYKPFPPHPTHYGTARGGSVSWLCRTEELLTVSAHFLHRDH